MSAGAQVALLGAGGRHASPPRVRAEAVPEQPILRLAAFAALGLYGVLRWSTLLSPAADGRLLALLALTVLLAGAGLLSHSKRLVVVLAVIAALAAFAIAGVPLSWVVHLRIAVSARAIGNGIASLPRASVPYTGINQWVRTVNVLGAAVLLFDAALLLAFTSRALGDLGRAAVALPMVALATVPATLLRPKFPYLDGLVLFGLLAAFMWGERIRRDKLGAALALLVLAGLAGMVAAPALERNKPWLNYQALTGGLAPGHVETFDWSQTYGPIHWPRKGRAVLDVQATQPMYWKAENLDVFDGSGWTLGSVVEGGNPLSDVSSATIRRWTQTLHVTLGAMSTTQVIAAGQASPPQHLPETLFAGASPGTWTTATEMGPGDSYSVGVYTPQPSVAELASASDQYPPGMLPGYLTISVPEPQRAGQDVIFPPFHSTASAAYGPTVNDAAGAMLGSPYARAYRLARRLARRSRTPYAFVTAVERYLARGYTYNESPPLSAYPLANFLFVSKEGYCQQFAGAMALLLRMGGVPARVAVGFTKGRYDSASKQWIVTDLDAHAWVEAWFPHYGWVQFDPTPAADPALGGQLVNLPGVGIAASPSLKPGNGTRSGAAALGGPVKRTASSNTGGGIGALEVLGIIAVLAVLATVAVGTRPLRGGDAMLAELEQALMRTGRTLPPGSTLSAIERRLGPDTDAAAYVRALRLQRFAGRGEAPTARQRRALRAQLGTGLGPLGWLRALWAVPPRRVVGPKRNDPSVARLH
jgi:hypothetical protein